MGLFRQFYPPKPTVTEANCPDQTGRVHVVTGSYTGCGLELAKMLYQHNATLFVAGRSSEKAEKAITAIKNEFPNSKGSVEFMQLDLADLTTIKPAVDKFIASQKQLHVLTLNAGVMTPPKGSKTTQGYELQIGTNCLGSYLLYKLLRPTLLATAKDAPAASVRVTWAASLAVDLMSPRPGGIKFVDGKTSGAPNQEMPPEPMYGQSKAGNRLLAAVSARADHDAGILHVAWNPGNLQTELQRHIAPWQAIIIKAILYPARFGGYTELFSAVGELDMSSSGGYIAPWGRVEHNRRDIEDACKAGGSGDKFVAWCDSEVASYA